MEFLLQIIQRNIKWKEFFFKVLDDSWSYEQLLEVQKKIEFDSDLNRIGQLFKG